MSDGPESISVTFLASRPAEAAAELGRLGPEEVAAFLATIPARIAAEPLAAMAPWQAGRCLAAMEPTQAAALLEALPAQQRARCLRAADDEAREAILGHVSTRRARAVRRQLRYPAALVGAWMAGDAITLSGEATVEEALAALQAQGQDNTVQLYVVDGDGKPIGLVTVAALARASAQQRIERLMRRELATINADLPISRIEAESAWGEHLERPVVDPRGRLVGALSLSRLAESRIHAGSGQTTGTSPAATLTSSYAITAVGLMRTAATLLARPGGSHHGR
jgi:Mg/Co/Ni transporter MgtE